MRVRHGRRDANALGCQRDPDARAARTVRTTRRIGIRRIDDIHLILRGEQHIACADVRPGDGHVAAAGRTVAGCHERGSPARLDRRAFLRRLVLAID